VYRLFYGQPFDADDRYLLRPWADLWSGLQTGTGDS
jgi:hypothetical protein